ncbi:hypothetical protein [Ferroacidibacillus organovorans]|uniref:Uncharacterized protein n=1 Tax=Ferroacidibacillus organovorans TaxID=1765683 RepID=A0A101XRB8_9BACL|nr:hypothetical protein [Ferroacidibacillus organovorans]KUO96133.1 hypothetical protein ATW55_14465 [Ferroacidibacillus organovorans]
MDTINSASSEEFLHFKLAEIGSGVRDETAGIVVIVAEYIRDWLWHLSLHMPQSFGQYKFSPVHILRLLDNVENQLTPAWSESSENGVGNDVFNIRNIIMWTLERLQEIGDVVKVGTHHWIPAPIRFVKMPDTERIFVFGGVSNSILKRQLPKLRYVGLGRYLLDVEIPDNMRHESNFWQSYTSWLGEIPDNLESWIDELKTVVNKHGGVSSASFADYEVFVSVPEVRRTTHKSWVSANELHCTREDIFLCRTTDFTEYFIGQIKNGQLLKELPMGNIDRQWLQIGLCTRHGLSPLATLKDTKIYFSPQLPEALRRRLMTCLVPLPPIEGRQQYYVSKGSLSDAENVYSYYGYQTKHVGGRQSI